MIIVSSIFLISSASTLQANAEKYNLQQIINNNHSTFAALNAWKNNFKTLENDQGIITLHTQSTTGLISGGLLSTDYIKYGLDSEIASEFFSTSNWKDYVTLKIRWADSWSSSEKEISKRNFERSGNGITAKNSFSTIK